MRAIDVIAKKRDGFALTREEIYWFVDAYTRGEVPDYQASAFLMAVVLKGMTHEEIAHLTMAMAQSGEMLDLSAEVGYSVDKHSTGGVGDKTTLIVLPLVASMGVPTPKMSGRGLGFSGGTLDKLESIAGYNVNLSKDQFIALAKQNGIVLAGQSADLAPADGKIYALRDATATVPSPALMVSSIMSKKIAAGANGIVLDVKTGRGAFLTSLEEARQVAQIMVDVGVSVGRDMVAVISDMNQPLGSAVGNALEVAEAIECLRGGGPADLREHCVHVAGYMLQLAGQGKKWTDHQEACALLEKQLDSDQAFAKFRQLVAAQGGDVRMVDDPSQLPQARIVENLTAARSGYIAQMAAEEIAMAAHVLGAGREKKGDPIDPAVGVKVHVKVGDQVRADAPLVTIYANDEAKLPACYAHLEQAVAYSDTPVDPLPLFYGTIYGNKRE